MLGYIFSSTLKEMLSFRKLAGWLLVIIIVGGLGYGWITLRQTQVSPLATFSGLMEIMGFRLVGLFAAVFSTTVIAAEVEQRTIVYLLTRPIPRWQLLVGRTLAAMVAVGLLSSLLVLVIYAVSTKGASNTSALIQDLGVVWLGGAANCALFVFFSLILNRSLIYCLLFTFGWEVFVPNMPGELFYASIYSHMKALSAYEVGSSVDTGAIVNTAAAPIQHPVAIAVLSGIAVVGLILSAFWFTQFEYVPREDAE